MVRDFGWWLRLFFYLFILMLCLPVIVLKVLSVLN